MSSDKKGGLALLLGIGKTKASSAPKSEPDMDEGDEESGDDFKSAADSAFDALKEDDREGFQAALKLAIMACSDYEDK